MIPTPHGCICSYTWGPDGQMVRNGPMASCSADHAGADPLIDPDCRAGKCASCVGGPCEHACHHRTPNVLPT